MSDHPENTLQPATRAEWRAWLEENYSRPNGVWLIYYKKSAGKNGVTYEELVEEALCFGWIDSKANRLDEERTLQWFSPRKRGGVWAQSNKQRVERLIREGRMAAPGLEKIEAARQDGSWNALDAIDALHIPEDLAAALASAPTAARYFDAFPPSAKRLILMWVASARRPETRAKRIAETVAQAERNLRAGPGQG